MPCTTSPADFHQKSIRIKHHDHDKFFTRLLTKESSKSHPSFRVYYGDVSSAVPFTWETRPGTPRHPSSSCLHSDIPPLTPPPSYSYAATSNSKLVSSTKPSAGPKLLLHTLLRRINTKKINSAPSHAPSSIYSSSSCSSTLSWTSSSRSLSSDPSVIPTTSANRRRRFSSWGSYFDHDHRRVDVDYCPNSNMCGKEQNQERSHVSLSIMKKAFLSIIGRGSS